MTVKWQETADIEGILPKGPYPPCLRMADKALLAGYPRSDVLKIYAESQWSQETLCRALWPVQL